MGSKDFSYFAREVPGIFFGLGVAHKKLGITACNHTPDFDVDETCLQTGVKVMSGMILDYLDQEAAKR